MTTAGQGPALLLLRCAHDEPRRPLTSRCLSRQESKACFEPQPEPEPNSALITALNVQIEHEEQEQHDIGNGLEPAYKPHQNHLQLRNLRGEIDGDGDGDGDWAGVSAWAEAGVREWGSMGGGERVSGKG